MMRLSNFLYVHSMNMYNTGAIIWFIADAGRWCVPLDNTNTLDEEQDHHFSSRKCMGLRLRDCHWVCSTAYIFVPPS